MQARIELRDLELAVDLGTYGDDDVVPEAHLIDLTLDIDPALVFIDADAMDRVFDYDPLIREIDRLARDGHYHTQERLMTRIVGACIAHPEIAGLSMCLRKTPVLGDSGHLGVRLCVEANDLARLRAADAAA